MNCSSIFEGQPFLTYSITLETIEPLAECLATLQAMLQENYKVLWLKLVLILSLWNDSLLKESGFPRFTTGRKTNL